MSMSFRVIRIALVAAALPAWSASAADMLSGEEIRGLVAGNTVQGTMEASGAYTEFYDADGTIRGKDYTGAWSIEGDQMCFQYGTDPKSCWQVGREGDQVQWLKDGKVDGSGSVVKGNPNGY